MLIKTFRSFQNMFMTAKKEMGAETAGSDVERDERNGNKIKRSPVEMAVAVTTDADNEVIELFEGEHNRIIKNLLIISLSFMFHYTAFFGISNIQSTINAENGLGNYSLSAKYIALAIACSFLPALLIKRLTAKWTLVYSMFCFLPYIAAQLAPSFYTLIPSGILVGMGASPMWAAQATYVTQISQVYAKISQQKVEAVVVRFFGIFYAAYQTSELWGNLLTSLVFQSKVNDDEANSTATIMDADGDEANFTLNCGAQFNAAIGDDELISQPSEGEVALISIISICFMIFAVFLLAILLDPLKRYGENRKGSKGMKDVSTRTLLLATYRQMSRKSQCLLVPITFFSGLQQAFVGADFTHAYVSCALGIHSIGYVMICFGIVNAICSFSFGSVTKYVGRIPMLVFGALLHAFFICVLVFCVPRAEQSWLMYVVAGGWGMSDAVWQTQLSGLYGLYFRSNKEAAFASYRLWESIGKVFGYATATSLNVFSKLLVLCLFLIWGMLSYISCEIRYNRKQRIRESQEEANQQQQQLHHHQQQAQQTKLQTEDAPESVGSDSDDEPDDLEQNIVFTHM